MFAGENLLYSPATGITWTHKRSRRKWPQEARSTFIKMSPIIFTEQNMDGITTDGDFHLTYQPTLSISNLTNTVKHQSFYSILSCRKLANDTTLSLFFLEWNQYHANFFPFRIWVTSIVKLAQYSTKQDPPTHIKHSRLIWPKCYH